ncbi:MAG: CdaR family protein [Anaerolineae bacterium]|jgi:YbbR domain-containing protein
MKGAFRWLIGNVGLIVLSLFLAMLVWWVAVEEESSTTERRYPSSIPVTISTPPEGMVAYGQTDTQAYVTIRTTESIWRSLQPHELHATVDLTGLQEGTHRLPIRVQVDRNPVMVRRVEPEAVTLHLEPRRQITLPIEVRIEGNTALGYVAQSPVVDPLTVAVSGPRSLVTQVVKARATVSVEGARADVEGEVELEPRDADGNVVPYLTLSPDRISVRVPIEQLSGFRDLSVMALVEGQTAPGYRISSIRVDPAVVTVFGPPNVISEIPGYIQTAPLNLEGASEEIEVELPLVIPEGVSLTGMEEPLVRVRVAVVPQEGSVTLQRPVEIQGLAVTTATVAPDTVEVILNGPLPVLEQLKEEDVRVIVDLLGLNPGSHSVEPEVVVVPSDGITWSVVPASVQVEIRALGTPTPTTPEESR